MKRRERYLAHLTTRGRIAKAVTLANIASPSFYTRRASALTINIQAAVIRWAWTATLCL